MSIRHEARGGLAERLPSGGGEQLDPVKFRAFADNVLVRLLPLPTQTASGLYTPSSDKRRVQESREAIVVASGPGYHNKAGKLVPNETRAGDRVLVPAQAGDIWHSALSAPRFNKTAEFRDLMGEEGEYRVVREQEILGVLERPEAQLSAEYTDYV